MKKVQENVDRVDQDAYKREQERIVREREAIAEMAGMSAEETKEAGRKRAPIGTRNKTFLPAHPVYGGEV